MQYLTGITFPQQTFTPAEWGQMFSAVMADGILNGCAVTGSGTNVNLAAGAMIIKGRLIEVPSTVTEATSPTYSSGYGRVKVCIDTTNTSTSLVNQQAYIDTEYSSSETFPALTQQDLNGSGPLYEVELAIVRYSGGSIAEVTQKLGPVFGANKLVGSDASGRLGDAGISLTDLSGINSNVQTQLDGKQSKITYGTADPAGGSTGDVYIKYTN